MNENDIRRIVREEIQAALTVLHEKVGNEANIDDAYQLMDSALYHTKEELRRSLAEAKLHESITRGIAQAEAGETFDLGDFSRYLPESLNHMSPGNKLHRGKRSNCTEPECYDPFKETDQ